MSWLLTPLKSTVAIKLITGHMMQTIIDDIAHVINNGLSCGVMKRNASAGASLPTMKNSSITAIGHIIGISWNASANT